MVANGWRRQNLLSDYHFNEENPQLNLAGETKVHYILTQMPPNRAHDLRAAWPARPT